jgi:hypothetical protein
MRSRILPAAVVAFAGLVCEAAHADKPKPAAAASAPAPVPGATAPSTADKPAAGESKVPGAAKAAGGVNLVNTEENKEGVKTYKFGAVEVEGRLRSPQLIYFLRRVRAEFSAGDLGHRSFLRELSETGRHPSFR